MVSMEQADQVEQAVVQAHLDQAEQVVVQAHLDQAEQAEVVVLLGHKVRKEDKAT